VSAALCAALLAAAAADPAPVLKALERSGRALKTMRAEFKETRVLTLLDERQHGEGTVLLEVPGRLRWDYHDPLRRRGAEPAAAARRLRAEAAEGRRGGAVRKVGCRR